MSLNVSEITGYVQANEKELLGKAILKGKTASIVSNQTGVKGTSNINLLNVTPVLQAGVCGWTASGTTAVTTRQIVSKLVKSEDSFCELDLVGTFMQTEMKIAAGLESLPFSEKFINQYAAAIQKSVEMNDWQGDYANTGVTYNSYDGFISVISAVSGSTINATLTGSTLAAAPITAINEIIANLPAEILDRDDLVIFVGQEIFMKYVAAMQAVNSFNYFPVLDGKTFSLVIPGYNIKLEGVAGLNLTNKAYASYAANFVIGMDLEGSTEKFEFWYSKDNSEFRTKVLFNRGVQVAFPDYIVTYLN